MWKRETLITPFKVSWELNEAIYMKEKAYSHFRHDKVKVLVTQSCLTLCDPIPIVFDKWQLNGWMNEWKKSVLPSSQSFGFFCLVGWLVCICFCFCFCSGRFNKQGQSGWLSIYNLYYHKYMLIQPVKNLPAMQETQEMQVWSLGQEDPLE